MLNKYNTILLAVVVVVVVVADVVVSKIFVVLANRVQVPNTDLVSLKRAFRALILDRSGDISN